MFPGGDRIELFHPLAKDCFPIAIKMLRGNGRENYT